MTDRKSPNKFKRVAIEDLQDIEIFLRNKYFRVRAQRRNGQCSCQTDPAFAL